MELIYIYIDKYRIYHDQAFSFSNKFNINYDPKYNSLSISRNEEYIDIYPSNIVGISGIVGKNATGKTSLLSLIGDRIEDRFRQHEIYEETATDPFEKIDIFRSPVENGNTELKYSCEYFLLYYVGIDDSAHDIFILETDNPFKYRALIESPNPLSNISEDDSQQQYYKEKGWCSWVLRRNGPTLTFLGTTNYYKEENELHTIEETSAVILFKQEATESLRGFDSLSEEESRISIKKRYALLHERWKYRQLLTIQKLMQKSSDTEMFHCQEYEVWVTLSDAYTFFHDDDEGDIDFSDFIVDYRNYDFDSKTFPQKLVLDFLEKYIQFVLSSYINENSYKTEDKKEVCKKLHSIKVHSNEFKDVVDAYYAQLGYVFEEHEDKTSIINGIKNAVDSYYDFLCNGNTYGISFEYKPSLLIFKISANSQLEKLEAFFKYVIDEPVYSASQREASVMGRFLTTKIYPLSDGEIANLALFTSIRDQIESIHPEKKHYILLFDEIEKSMHPEMCRRLISDLISFFGNFTNKEFQIIIASHSPFIASDIRKENLICLPSVMAGQKDGMSLGNPFGQNIHTLLKEKFYLTSTFGAHATEIITMIIKCLHSPDTHSMLDIINNTLDFKGSQISKQIPHSDDEVLPYLEHIIGIIGEPIIKSQLDRMLVNWKTTHLSKIERIMQLEAQIKQLQKEMK